MTLTYQPGPDRNPGDELAPSRPQEQTRVPQYRLLLRGRRPSDCFADAETAAGTATAMQAADPPLRAG